MEGRIELKTNTDIQCNYTCDSKRDRIIVEDKAYCIYKDKKKKQELMPYNHCLSENKNNQNDKKNKNHLKTPEVNTISLKMNELKSQYIH